MVRTFAQHVILSKLQLYQQCDSIRKPVRVQRVELETRKHHAIDEEFFKAGVRAPLECGHWCAGHSSKDFVLKTAPRALRCHARGAWQSVVCTASWPMTISSVCLSCMSKFVWLPSCKPNHGLGCAYQLIPCSCNALQRSDANQPVACTRR